MARTFAHPIQKANDLPAVHAAGGQGAAQAASHTNGPFFLRSSFIKRQKLRLSNSKTAYDARCVPAAISVCRRFYGADADFSSVFSRMLHAGHILLIQGM